MYALGMVLVFLGMKEGDGILPSFALMLCFHLYLRPGELYRLRWRHITLPNPSTPRSAAVVLHPTEEERASKVRDFDETIIVDEPWMVEALKWCYPDQTHRLDEFVTGVSPERFLVLFRRAQRVLRLPDDLGAQQLYVIRHSTGLQSAELGRS